MFYICYIYAYIHIEICIHVATYLVGKICNKGTGVPETKANANEIGVHHTFYEAKRACPKLETWTCHKPKNTNVSSRASGTRFDANVIIRTYVSPSTDPPENLPLRSGKMRLRFSPIPRNNPKKRWWQASSSWVNRGTFLPATIYQIRFVNTYRYP